MNRPLLGLIVAALVALLMGQVLDAVGALGRATAGEVAKHAALPNGSVSVTLRALVARGRVVRTETARGAEHSLP